MIRDVDEVGALPLMNDGRVSPQLSDVATLAAGTMPGLIERYNGQRVVSLTANLHAVTIGGAAPQIRRAIAAAGEPPRGTTVRLRGQIPPLEDTLRGLQGGLLVAVLAIVLLLAANFQSVRLAAAIVATIPAVLCGAMVTMWATGTTINVQSFMGAIMATGIAVANAILLVTFAERARRDGHDAADAARTGALGRLRAILMTAGAMIAGMLPMAIGISEAGAQAAPLGRAVIGGLLLSTATTLLVLPSVYALFQRHASTASASLNPLDPESRYHDRS